MEVWEPIKGYEGLYEISNKGRVKGFKVRNAYQEHILKPLFDKDGYCKVNLYKDRKMKRVSVHKLVALTFLGEEEGKQQINHIDGNKENNCVENLEWCTPKENIHHSIKIGLAKKKGKYNYKARKIICVTTGKIYDCIVDAEKETGVSHQNIVKVCRGQRNYAGKDKNGNPLVWKYEEESLNE